MAGGPRSVVDAVSRWLCPTEVHRMRFIDMNDSVRTARRVQAVTILSSALVAAMSYGWWLAGLVAVTIGVLGLLERGYRAGAHLDLVAAANVALVTVILALGVLGTGGLRSPLLPFLTIPVIMLAARFRPLVVTVGVAYSLTLTAAAAVGAALLPPVPGAPGALLAVIYLAVMASLVAAAMTLLNAELRSRGDAVVDQLTGLFTRKALHGRFAEVAAQARLIGSSTSLIMCDVDHFKAVNDQYGHDRGDLVLSEVARRMRATLRSFDLVYRLGGEEFLVLLPNHDESAALAIAERLVHDLAAEPVAGLAVTMSAGVASSDAPGVDIDAILKSADVSLYAAKRAGRNRVHAASWTPEQGTATTDAAIR